MKKLLFLILLLLSYEAQSQIAIYFGDSELKGLLGGELKVWHLSLNAGWRPNRTLLDDHYASYSAALTYYQPIDGYMPYLSVGIASKGITYEKDLQQIQEKSYLATAGIEILPSYYFPKVSDRFKSDWGVGINTSGKRTLVSIEVLLKYDLIKFRR